MEKYQIIWEALALFSLPDLLYMSGGVLLGIIFAAIPGLSGSIGVAILLPFTYFLSPIRSLITLGGLYVGAMYGGSISAILLNIPGTGAAVATAIDGYPLAQRGQAPEALYASAFASFIGGIIGVFFLFVLIQPLARLSLKFGPAEFFWLAVMGISTIASLASANLIKGILMGLFGLFLSCIGLDPMTGTNRFTFGFPVLAGGVPIIPIIIAMFAIPQILRYLEEKKATIGTYIPQKGIGLYTARIMFGKMKILLIKSSIIGTIIGIIPGAGGYVASLVSYIEAKRSSPRPEEFGTGRLEGVVAAESGNSATVGGALIPMLTFGIPGSNVTAVFIGALLMHGFEPGPNLFAEEGNTVIAFILSLFLSYLVMLIFGIYGPKFFSQVLKIRRNIVIASLLVISVVGAYSMRGNMADVIVMLVLGIAGYLLMKLEFPLQPVVLGLILGTMAERGLRHSITLGGIKDSVLKYLFLRPISLCLIIFTLMIVFFPLFQEHWSRRKGENAQFIQESERGKLTFRAREQKRKFSDLISATIIFLLSIFLLSSLSQYQSGARIFPRFILINAILFSVLLFFSNLVKKEWASVEEGLFGGLPSVPWFKLLLVVIPYSIFILGFNRFGFIISSFVFCLFILIVTHPEKMAEKAFSKLFFQYLTFSLIMNGAIYFVFIKTLNLNLPVYFLDYLFNIFGT